MHYVIRKSLLREGSAAHRTNTPHIGHPANFKGNAKDPIENNEDKITQVADTAPMENRV